MDVRVDEAGHDHEVAQVAARDARGYRVGVDDRRDPLAFHQDRGRPLPLLREDSAADDGVRAHGTGGRSFQLRIAFQTSRKSDSVW